MAALDTADKRHSVMGEHWRPTYPMPNSTTLDQHDRQQVVGVYCGNLAGGLPPPGEAYLIGQSGE